MRRFLIILLCAAILPSCASITPRRTASPLFLDPLTSDRLDFETNTVGRAPSGFAGDITEFVVADSPTAASGELVVVHRGGKGGSLTLTQSGGGKELRGEAAVRVLIGVPGAGVACEAPGGAGYLVRVEPDAKRVALYERSAGNLDLVGEAPTAVTKGSWARLGIRCGNGQVTGYVDGVAVVTKRATVETSMLALHAAESVTAQFDDVVFTARD